MSEYQLTATDQIVIRTADGACIPNDDGNRDWQEYVQWLQDGGVPDPYVPPDPVPPPPDPLVEAQRANARLDAGIAAAQGATAGRFVVEAPAPRDPNDPVTQAQLDALQAQVDALQSSVTAMLQAQADTPAAS